MQDNDPETQKLIAFVLIPTQQLDEILSKAISSPRVSTNAPGNWKVSH